HAHARQCRACHARSPTADSPPQRIHALLSATPRPGTTIAQSLAWPRKKLAIEASQHGGSELCPGDRGSRKAKHGCFARDSGQGERGWLARHAARPRERPARCAGPDRAAALTERKAIPGRQGAASIRSLEG